MGVRSHGWSHAVSNVLMNKWVLKKFSMDTFDGIEDYVKDMKSRDGEQMCGMVPGLGVFR